jgi:N-acyl-D-aspartate/D-glutamate deacylase
MPTAYDVVIRNGTILDGSGGEGYQADVAVAGGVIAAVGKCAAGGREEIDAKGQLVTPGFVDIHTHYDGQVTWEERMEPSSSHGVTTVLMGNCGVGFAPCRAGDRQRLIHLMEGVEDVPEAVMAEGLPWNWETFPEYLDAVDARRHDIDVAAQLPHSCVRVFVMGERGAQREAATPDDLQAMTALAEQAMRAGALGFGTSRSVAHQDSRGTPIPTKDAAELELHAIAAGIKAAGHGVMQALSDAWDVERDLEMWTRIARRWRLPVSFTLAQIKEERDTWRTVLDRLEERRQEGLHIKAQVIGRPTGLLLGLDLSYNPLSLYPSYEPFNTLPLAEKVAALRRPEVRARILGDEPQTGKYFLLNYMRSFDRLFVLGDPPNYEPDVNQSIAAIAARQGVRPEEVLYDTLLEKDGNQILFIPYANYADGNMDAALGMVQDRNTIMGLGDGGAHYGMLCDAGYPTFMLTHWTRDRKGTKLPVSQVIKGLTRVPAEAVGLTDRGLIAPGHKADINVIDYPRLRIHLPKVAYDLPSRGRRLTQMATGYTATMVGGIITRREGEPTGALPGRLIRGPQTPKRVAS